MTSRSLGVLGTLLLFSPSASTQNGSIFLTLTVERNGQAIPAPDYFELSYDGQSVQVPLRGGKFEIPASAADAKDLVFEADLDGELIRIDGISGPHLVHEDWKLILADKSYGDDFEWILKKSKHVNVRSSCILVFEPTNKGDGTFVFVTNCRKH